MSNMKILIVDGMNFLHRARAGFNLGDYPVVFNAIRNLRALVEKHSPTRAFFVMEGHPKKRYELLPEYKANRQIDPNDPQAREKRAELEKFFHQADLVVSLLTMHFPVSVVRHPDWECDDTIYNLIKRSTAACEWVVCSNDSDFKQLLAEFPNVRLYNPITKQFVEGPKDYDYVTWKALRGDGSDNVPGLPGISDSRAAEIASDPALLESFLSDQALAEQFDRNYNLIRFAEWTEEEALQMTSSVPMCDWSAVAQRFGDWQFKSLLKEPTWTKFRTTFQPLWG